MAFILSLLCTTFRDSLLPLRQNPNSCYWHPKQHTICFLAYLFPDKTALPSLSLLTTPGAFQLPAQCSPPTLPQGCPHLASLGEHHPFSRAVLQSYLLSETLATTSHSDISLLSSPVKSLRTCLPEWTSTPEDIVGPSHLRLLTCWSHMTCKVGGRYHLPNEQINTWGTLAYSNCWFFKGLGACIYSAYQWVCGTNATACLFSWVVGLRRNWAMIQGWGWWQYNLKCLVFIKCLPVPVLHIHDLLLCL